MVFIFILGNFEQYLGCIQRLFSGMYENHDLFIPGQFLSCKIITNIIVNIPFIPSNPTLDILRNILDPKESLLQRDWSVRGIKIKQIFFIDLHEHSNIDIIGCGC